MHLDHQLPQKFRSKEPEKHKTLQRRKQRDRKIGLDLQVSLRDTLCKEDIEPLTAELDRWFGQVIAIRYLNKETEA